MLSSKCSGIIFIIVFVCSLTGLSQALRFDNLSTERGLVTDEVFNLYQDREGYIWVFTMFGTLKYDGSQFKPVLKNLPVSESFIYCMYEKKDGRKWVANHRANIYEIRNDSALLVKGFESVSRKLRNTTSEISQLYVNDSLDLYLITKRYCMKLPLRQGKYLPVDLRQFISSDSIIYRILEMDNKVLLVYNFPGKDLHEFFTEAPIITQVCINGKEKTIHIPGVKNSGLWICKKIGRDIYCGHYNQLVKISGNGSVKNITFGARINNFTKDSRGHMWVGCSRGGLYEVSVNDSILNHSLGNITVNDVLADTQGGIWASTATQGLFHCTNPDHFYFKEPDLLGKPLAFIKVMNEKLFIANTMGDIYALEKDKLTTIKKPEHDNEPTDIMEYKDRYFISFRDHLEIIYRDKSLQASHNVRSIYRAYGRALYNLNPDTILAIQRQGFSYFSGERHLEQLVFDKKIFNVHTWKNSLLVGTAEGLYELRAGRLVQPVYAIATRGISIGGFRSDPKGNLWFYSEGYGLFVLESNNIIKKISVLQGLPSDIIYDLSFTSDGRILLSTNKGLFVSDYSIDPSRLKWNNIFNEAVSQAIFYNGKIYLNSRGQLSVLNSLKLPDKTKHYFHLARITRDSTEVNVSLLNEMTPNPNRITFDFVFISFAGNKPKLNYSLDGPVKEKVTTNSYELSFNNLPPGAYTLQVCPQLDNASAFQKTILFNILPAFYQTLPFRIMALLLFTGAVVLFAWLYFRRMKKIMDTKQKAEQLILEYQLIALRAQINPHFMSNCLSSIQNLILNMKLHEAADYISKFGLLVRKILDFSTRSLITVEEEIEIAGLYLELEQLRFSTGFNFTIVIEEPSDVKSCFVPSLILNPVLENAVWHGLSSLKKEQRGEIKICISAYGEELKIVVSDNGPGFNNKRPTADSTRKSKGIELTRQRLSSINSLYHVHISRLIYEEQADIENGNKGSKAVITLPLHLDPNI